MKPAPTFSRAVDSMLNPVIRSTTRMTRGLPAARLVSSSVPCTGRVRVGLSRYSGCWNVTCPAPSRAASRIMSAQLRSCSAIMMTERKTPKMIAESVMVVRRRFRHRLRHAILARLPFFMTPALSF